MHRFNLKMRIGKMGISTVLMLVYDLVSVFLAYFLALWIRFDFKYTSIPKEYLCTYLKVIPFYAIYCLIIYWAFKLYKSVWRFASIRELIRTIDATIVTIIPHMAVTTLFVSIMPASYFIIGTGLQFVLSIAIRFSYRFILIERRKKLASILSSDYSRVMLIGAGSTGRIIIRDVNISQDFKNRICCVIDDNPYKWGKEIEGIPIIGGRDDIIRVAAEMKIDKIFFAIPSAKMEDRRDILNICKETGCELKTLPSVYQLVNDEVSIADMKDVAVEDLLGRDPITVDIAEIFGALSDKVILITGGGGSIGSELARQVAEHKPKQLILFDICENGLYDIEQELRRHKPDLNLVALVGSVRDGRKINSVFQTYRPDIVYHAAAHKHVPLMETSPCESIKNNVMGTYKTACAAMLNDCKKFVLISTDKAVNPTNIMGASKRICEMIIQGMEIIRENKTFDLVPCIKSNFGIVQDLDENVEVDRITLEQGKAIVVDELRRVDPKTEFVAVRFGNVLGSNGSVIPLFKKQIAEGGPVTVTHPDINRFFMTIPEAVSLVLQAGAYARGGEVFVLDMGEPIRIDTLARNLIKLSGHKPDRDIKIVYTGLRPGEKLYEEKLMDEEGLQTTANKLIFIGKPVPFALDEFVKQIEEIDEISYTNSSDIIRIVEEIVPTFNPEAEKQDGTRKTNDDEYPENSGGGTASLLWQKKESESATDEKVHE